MDILFLSISPKRSKQLVYVNTNLQKIPKGANFFGEQILSLKNRKTAILNSENIRMLQTHVNDDIYNKYCLHITLPLFQEKKDL